MKQEGFPKSISGRKLLRCMTFELVMNISIFLKALNPNIFVSVSKRERIRWLVVVKLASHPYNTRYKGKRKMTRKDGTESDNEEGRDQLVPREFASLEENRLLKQQIAEMYQAWANGQAPPSSIPGLSDANHPSSTQAQVDDPLYPPGFGPYANVSSAAGTSTMRPPNPSFTNNPLFIPAVTTNINPPSMIQKPINELNHDQVYPPELAFKPVNSYQPTHQPESHIVIEKAIMNEEREEIVRKVRSLEQSMRNIQGLGGHKSVSFKDLCMFPNVHLPIGFKTPKFDKYSGHGDPVAHLKRYCNQLRGAGGKEELLMAYFGESLTGIASEWFIDQDISHWHVWDDMAQDFVQQFQYNLDIIPDRTSLANMKKKPSESFREFAIKWREQASRVKPPLKDQELIDIFLQTQESDYFHHLLAAVGKPFTEAIKIGEMVENGIKSGKIMSQTALRATTQAIQSGSGSFGNRKKKEEGSMMASGPGNAQRGRNSPYVHVQQGQPSPPQHYYTPQPAVLNAQAYARPPQRP